MGGREEWTPETGGPHPPALGLCAPRCVQRPGGEMQRDGNREQHMDQSSYRAVTSGDKSWMKAERQAPATQGLEGPRRVPPLHLQTHQNRMSQKFWEQASALRTCQAIYLQEIDSLNYVGQTHKL